MSVIIPEGVVAVSVDVDVAGKAGANGDNVLQALTGALLERLARRQIAATWAISDTVRAPFVERVLASCPAQEVAILGGNWTARDVTRAVFSAELSRRTASALAAGFTISTLVVEADELPHADLALKHGITAVRTQHPQDGKGPLGPSPISFGLWHLPATLALNTTQSWPRRLIGKSDASRVHRHVERIAAEGGLLHLNVKVRSFLTQMSAAWESLDAILGHLQQAGLKIETLSQVATRLSQPHHRASPARSILRRAA